MSKLQAKHAWKPSLAASWTALSVICFKGTTLLPRAPPEAVITTLALHKQTAIKYASNHASAMQFLSREEVATRITPRGLPIRSTP